MLFAVNMKREWVEDENVKAIQKHFKKEMIWYSLILAIIPFSCLFIPYFSIQMTIWMVWLIVAIILLMLPTVFANNRLKQWKRKMGYYEEQSAERYVELKNAGTVHCMHFLPFFVPLALGTVAAIAVIPFAKVMGIFCLIGAAVGLADNDGTAGLAGLVSYLMMQQLLSPGVVGMVRTLEEGTATYIAFQKVAGNSFIGILAAIVGAACYNKFKNTQLPDWLAFFSGKRFVAIATGLISILVSVVLLFVWPVIFDALVAIGNGIAGMDGIGAGIYAFLNRLLIPTGLHHALNNVFWFDTIGLGDLSHFWAGETSADVGWSLGMYMSGFFPCMMFGIAGAALAMVRTAKNKKAAIGLVLSAAICAFVCGVTEPFEFGFMFLCFPLYIVYSALYGIFTIITYYSGFRAGFCFSAGATDLVFSASLPAAAKTWMIIPLGIAAFLVFYFVFYFAITKFDLKTPGREDEDAEEAEKKVTLANNNYTEVASGVLKAIGGKANVSSVDYCATRLRFTIKDYTQVDEKAVKAAGAAGVIRPDKNTCQVIIGTKVQFVYDELKKML